MKAYAVLAFALSAAPAFSQEVTIYNHSRVEIVGISGDPAVVDDFRPIAAGGHDRVLIAMPEGQCETMLVIAFADGSRTEAVADICSGGPLRLTESY